MAGHEASAHARLPARQADRRTARDPPAKRVATSPGAAAQLAALRRTLRLGPDLRLEPGAAAGPIGLSPRNDRRGDSGPNRQGGTPVQGKFIYGGRREMSPSAYARIGRALANEPALADFTTRGAASAEFEFTAWLKAASAQMSADAFEHITAIGLVDSERQGAAAAPTAASSSASPAAAASPASAIAQAPAPAAAAAAAVVDPVAAIAGAALSNQYRTALAGSRSKIVYLFTAGGAPTTNKLAARYMVDTGMDEGEYKALRFVEGHGLPIPAIYGNHPKGPIVQWIWPHGTLGGGGGRRLLSEAQKMMAIDKMNRKGFAMARWRQALADVEKLIAANFSSPDLQFMVEEATGRIYMMDFDKENPPSFGNKPDPRLVELRAFLLQAIAEAEKAAASAAPAAPAGAAAAAAATAAAPATGPGSSSAVGAAPTKK